MSETLMAEYISIHAPPRGATRKQYKCTSNGKFQFTPLREGRLMPCLTVDCHKEFQFTPLREGRRPAPSANQPTSYFNSRPSARGDARSPGKTRRTPLFQFTPLREGRPNLGVFYAETLPDFNSRPSARGDRKRYAISANLLFNPYKSAWLNNRATQFVEIILVIFHRIIV